MSETVEVRKSCWVCKHMYFEQDPRSEPTGKPLRLTEKCDITDETCGEPCEGFETDITLKPNLNLSE